MRQDHQLDHGSRPIASSPGARDVALAALAASRQRRCFVDQALQDQPAFAQLAPADAALANELTLGVVRHRLTLSRVLSAMLKGDPRRVRPAIRDAMLIGAYQLIWLDRVPPFAAVDQAVEQAKREDGRKVGGLVNAILRELLRRQQERRCRFDRADPRRCIRVDYQRGCLFDFDLLPDPNAEPVEYLSLATSHPATLVGRWRKYFGLPATRQICWAGQFRPPLCLRPNTLRIEPEALVRQLASEGNTVEFDRARRAVWVAAGPPLPRIRAFAAGLCQPQDPTAMDVVRRAGLEPGMNVLDLCAAPGTKTTQMAEVMEHRGCVVACDVDDRKLGLIRQNAHRLDIDLVQTTLPDGLSHWRERLGRFDVIFVDAPCSNTGVLARRPEARYRFSPQQVQSLVALQAQLLDRAAALADAETRIVYSTCSIEPEENEQAIQHFCVRHQDWRLVDSMQRLPQAGATCLDWQDGGFVAELRRGE